MIAISVMKIRVAIVIPNWNGADFIEECLVSLKAQTYPVDVIVVDNGSADDSIAIIEKKFSDIKLIKLVKNLGFAGGVNKGIQFAIENNYQAVALFNNDATADPRWAETLVSTLKKYPKAGIVTGKFMRTDKQLMDSTGEFYTIWGMPYPRGRNQKISAKYNETERVFAASGGASLYKTKLFYDIGFFDENFFAYLEDIDISFRANLRSWQVIYEPNALAYHRVGSTTSRLKTFSRYHFTKNFFLTYVKNMPGLLFWKYLPLFLVQSLRLALSSIVRMHFITFLKALAVSFFLLPSTLRSRRIIQKSRSIPISTIDKLLSHHRPPKIPKIS
jgi:GT2 family glycosyltransferase